MIVGGENVAVQVRIDENKIDNFSTGAQGLLEKQIIRYADDIIKEANLIEETIREDGASTEITSNIILQAVRKNKTNHNIRTKKYLIALRTTSAFSVLFTGILFDSDGYKDNIIKFIIFIIIFFIASVSTVLLYVFEDKE